MTRQHFNKRGIDAGQWPYIVALVLGLMALAFFAWILIQARAADQSIFDMLERALGF